MKKNTQLEYPRRGAGKIWGGGWKILNLYMSKPVGRCQEEKLLTLDFGYRMEADGGSVVSRELLELLSDVCPGGLWGAYLEPGFPLYLINDEMLGYLGYTYQEFVEATGMLVMNNVVPEDRERVEREILEQLQNKKNYELRYRCWTKSGSVLWMFSRGRKVMTSEGRPVIIGMVLDISKDIALHENLRKEAATDALTKIYNRREALKRIELFFEQYQNGTLFIIDIDNFKALNDTYGHPAGDEVLVALAEMLKRSVRCQDVVARLGGDEFLVYFPSMGEQAAICAKAQMLQEKFASLSEKYGISDLHISIGASMHRKGECFEELYRRADEALYKVKHTMKGGFYLEEAPV